MEWLPSRGSGLQPCTVTSPLLHPLQRGSHPYAQPSYTLTDISPVSLERNSCHGEAVWCPFPAFSPHPVLQQHPVGSNYSKKRNVGISFFLLLQIWTPLRSHLTSKKFGLSLTHSLNFTYINTLSVYWQKSERHLAFLPFKWFWT